MATSGMAAAPWALPEWRYRVPVQVHNRAEYAQAKAVVWLKDFPFPLLMSEGKLAAGAQDVRLLDEEGKLVPLKAENPNSDLGDGRLRFALKALPPHGRRLLWLYYGNSKAEAATAPPEDPLAAAEEARAGRGVEDGPALPADALALGKEIRASLGAEESAKPAPAVTGPVLDKWLKDREFIEAETLAGQGFARMQVGEKLASATSGGAVLAASGRANDSAAYDFEVNEGRHFCWIRCASTAPGKPAQGSLVLGLECKDQAPAVLTEQFNTGDPLFRWVGLSTTVPARGKLRVTVQGKSTFAGLDCLVLTRDPQYRPDYRDFQGRVWVRWRIEKPADYRYSAKVHNEINPYTPKFQLTGAVTPYGLQADLDQLPFREDSDCFAAGQYSPWVPLPDSTAAQWHSVLSFPPKPGTKLPREKGDRVPSGCHLPERPEGCCAQMVPVPFSPPEDMTVRLEFANRPSANRIFHVTAAEPVEKGSASLGVRMPTTTKLEGLQQLETFNEWAQRRCDLVQQLRLGPPPRLTRLKVGTWVMMNTRIGGGTVSRQAADVAYNGLEVIGVNFPSVSGVDDALAGEMMTKHSMIGTTWTAWAGNWFYTNERSSGQYNFKADETPPQRWQRVFDDFYSKSAAAARKSHPNAVKAASHVNLGDEVGQATSADEIAKTRQILAYFRTWLHERGLKPADFGENSWEKVMPLDTRKEIVGQEGTPQVRLYYWTWQFINEYTAIFYRAATAAAKKHFPAGRLYCVNYQAGPMQFAYVGNNNDTDRGMMDIFHLSRTGAMQGVMMEDWVHGWDLGVGRDCLGAEIMRAAARKLDLPLASYLVGGEAIRAEFIAFLMHGIKENDLYLYGPITNIGPAWGEQPKALRETAEVTRQVKKFEDAIADGVLRPRKAAMLIAVTSDIMQKKGLYFCQERQDLYVTLKHDGLPVDVVCEQDIVDDDLLKQYDLLYVCDPQVRDDVQSKIADWVKAGGKLWACVGALLWDRGPVPRRTGRARARTIGRTLRWCFNLSNSIYTDTPP